MAAHEEVPLRAGGEGAPHYLGHNPLQQIAYTAIYAPGRRTGADGLLPVRARDTGGFFFAAFSWVGSLLGGAQIVRFVHHVLTWFWLIFLPVHLYLTIRSDVLHKESRVTSIVSGESFVRSDIHYVDD